MSEHVISAPAYGHYLQPLLYDLQGQANLGNDIRGGSFRE